MVFADGRMVERVDTLEATVRQLESEVASLQDDLSEVKKTLEAVVERLL